jgi:carotenoid cleavage dioxygenase-like enzyme
MNAQQISQRQTSNPFLTANFAPVQTENVIYDLPVKGSIPEELNGRFLRIGPNPAPGSAGKNYHWFMGTGMVHGLRLEGGKAKWYRNNYVITDAVAGILKKNKLMRPRQVRGGSVNTNVLAIGGELYALVEAGEMPVKLDGDLESQSYSDFGGSLEAGFSAHPRKDPVTGNLHAITYAPGRAHLDYLVVDKTGQSKKVAQLKAPHQPLIHDTAITRSFVVVLDLPVTFSLLLAASGTFPYTWNRKQQPRIGLLPRDDNQSESREIRWFEAPSCFVYHILNAYEKGDQVIIDVVKNALNFEAKFFDHNHKAPSLVRWTIDLSTSKVSEQILCEYPVEFPRLNDKFVGEANRYGYTATMTENLELGPTYKHDLVTGETQIHDYGPGRSSLEPVFVARQNAVEEDDGFIISYVHDRDTDKSEVVILDAQDFTGEPLASIQLPVRVPYGFHGNWIADGELR